MTTILTTDEITNIVENIKQVKKQIKKLLKQQSKLTQDLYNLMGENEMLVTEDGETLATWKYNSDTRAFDSKRFKEEMTDVYNAYCVEKPGARVLLLKDVD